MSRIYLARWEWATDDTGLHWRAPGGGNVGGLDVRSRPQRERRGGTPEGHAIFTYPNVRDIRGAVFLGDDPLARMRAATRNAMADALEIDRSLLPDDSLARILVDGILGPLADPTGQTRWKPLRFDSRRRVRLILGGFGLLVDEPVTDAHPAFAATEAVFRADYRRQRAAGAPLGALRRFTGSTMLKMYGRMSEANADRLLPPEHRGDGWERPETTFTESFPTDTTDLNGSTQQDLDWTEHDGDTDVVSGRAQEQTSPGFCRAEADVSSDDHRTQVDIFPDATGGFTGPITRWNTVQLDAYGFAVRQAIEGRITRYDNGTRTDMLTVTEPGDTGVYVECDGSTIAVGDSTGQINSTTDTNHTGFMRGGFRLSGNIPEADNYQIADVGAGGQDLIETPAETIQVSEATKRLLALRRFASETMDMAEDVVQSLERVRPLAESLDLEESTVTIRDLARRAGLQLGIVEAASAVLGISREAAEDLSLAEAVSQVLGIVRQADESMGLTETVSRALGQARSVQEQVGAVEAVLSVRAMTRTVSETMSLAESPAPVRALVRPLTETLDLAETLVKRADLLRVLAESVDLTEGTVTVLPEQVAAAFDLTMPTRSLDLLAPDRALDLTAPTRSMDLEIAAR